MLYFSGKIKTGISHEISSFLGATAFENIHFRVIYNVYKVCCINKYPNHFTCTENSHVHKKVSV